MIKLKHLFVKSNFKIISDQENIPKHDYHIFLMSLPGRLFQKNKIFPKEINYIPINNKIYSSWKGRLSSIEGIKIGINWHGNIKHKHDKPRSISLLLIVRGGVISMTLPKERRIKPSSKQR